MTDLHPYRVILVFLRMGVLLAVSGCLSQAERGGRPGVRARTAQEQGEELGGAAARLPDAAAEERRDPGGERGASGSELWPGPSASPGTTAPQDPPFPIHGSFRLGWRGRWAGGDSDNDLFTYLALDAGDPARHFATYHVSARATKDLSGGKSTDDVFFDTTDTYDDGLEAHLYRAYVDVHGLDELSILRLGRQQDVATPEPAYYDGVHVRTRDFLAGKLFVGGYAGFSVHQYESVDSEDRVAGAYLGSRPWKGGRLRFDWMQARDHRRTDGDAEDLYSIALWQTIAEKLSLEGFYSRFDGRDRDLRLRGSWYDPGLDLQVMGSYYQLLDTQEQQALEFDPFTDSLLEYDPYQIVSVSASKGFGPRFRLAGGMDQRWLSDGGDEGQFNRDFGRYYLTTTFGELLAKTSAVSLTGDYWDGGGKQYATLGFDLSSELTERLRSSTGTYYSMYKLQSFDGSETEDVRSYYLRLDYELTSSLSADLTYDFEDSDIDDFHTLRIDLKWHF